MTLFDADHSNSFCGFLVEHVYHFITVLMTYNTLGLLKRFKDLFNEKSLCFDFESCLQTGGTADRHSLNLAQQFISHET